MLLALAQKLLAQAKASDHPLAGGAPIGTLTLMELYPVPRYGEIDGIGTVRIEGEGNMVGFSPVTKCVELEHGRETAWLPTELVKGSRLEPFAFTPSTR